MGTTGPFKMHSMLRDPKSSDRFEIAVLVPWRQKLSTKRTSLGCTKVDLYQKNMLLASMTTLETYKNTRHYASHTLKRWNYLLSWSDHKAFSSAPGLKGL